MDRCGEFMLAAEEEGGFVPGEVKPAGGKMEIPEEGINLDVSTTELRIWQDYPPEDGTAFLKACEISTSLVRKFFTPSQISKNGILSRWIWGFDAQELALKSTIELGGGVPQGLKKIVEMVPVYSDWETGFRSASKDLRIKLQVLGIGTNRHSQVAPYGASSLQKRRAEKFNRKSERLPKGGQTAVSLSIDLMEEDPPEGADIRAHFGDLQTLQGKLLKAIRPNERFP